MAKSKKKRAKNTVPEVEFYADFDDYLKVMRDTTPKAMQKGKLKNTFSNHVMKMINDFSKENNDTLFKYYEYWI